ncbi:MAG: HD domain-containing protein [Planctomycetota bacterium]|nr:HD domain-containing protein [Planctomycetota bacterium]
MTVADMIPISLATLSGSTSVGLDLCLRSAEDDQLTLYRRSDIPMEAEDLERLRSRGVKQLFIRHSDRAQYQAYLRTIADTAFSTKHCHQPGAVTAAVNEVVLDVLQSAFASGNDDHLIESANELGTLTAKLITSDGFAAGDLLNVLRHDYATFTHSANVAFYCGLLAAETGFSSDEIQKIVVGGLLHDLGKLDIAEKILCKPGRLSEWEFRTIAMHPTIGFRRLARRSDLTAHQLLMAYQHHERPDGQGYPTGCVAEDIDPWAKICSVVDVFEALTSFRPYRSTMSRKRAIEIMAAERGAAFDPELLSCWIRIIQNCSAS